MGRAVACRVFAVCRYKEKGGGTRFLRMRAGPARKASISENESRPGKESVNIRE